MLDKLVAKLTPDYSNLKYKSVFGILFAVSFFVRLPFFFRDYIDRDESTFILMGQSWVDGHLPYMELWDLKPPITFLFFAAIIYVFGKSFVAIRLFGALLIAITAFYSYKIAITATTKKVGFWSAIACVSLLSLFGSLQGVMSEHIGMAFFVPGLYLFLKKRENHWYFVAGLLMGLALMTKLNMAYVVFLLGIYLFWKYAKKKEYTIGVTKCLLFGFGIVLIVFSTFLPYYLNGNPMVWWNSVVMASLEYANASKTSLLKFVPMTLFMAVFFFLGHKRKYLDFKNETILVLSLTVAAIVFTFIKGGRLNGHYLIQLHPIFIILFGIFLSSIPALKRLNYRPYIVFILLLLPSESYLEYYRIVENKFERGTFFNGEGITVPKYINENNVSTENILFLGYHIGYWVLDAKPPTKAATHPSNICRSEIFPFLDNPRHTNMEELRYIMEAVRPKTVVIRKNRSIFDPLLVEENRYIDNYLGQYYKKPKSVDQAEIFEKLE